MRIAMVSEHANPLASLGGVDAGGQNVYVASLADHLTRRGHEVTVYTRRDGPMPQRRVVAPAGYVVEHVAAGPAADVPKDELLPHMPAFADHLETAWANNPPDVVHAHFWMSGLAARDAAESISVPVLQTFHALGTVKRRHQGLRDTSPLSRIRLEKQLCRTVDHVVATCRDEVRELGAMGLDPRDATVVPCGVEVSDHVDAAPPANPHPRLLVLGRIVERKGVGNAISALAKLPGVDLLIAGGPARDSLSADPEVSRLRDIARRDGTADRVTFLGRVGHDDVPALISSVDVVVAVPWYEPFGIVPLEAMACGRPVVGSAVGGLLDTVVPGVTGELVPPRRPDILAGVLQKLIDDPTRRGAYGAAGLARARSTYRWDLVAAATESVYERVLLQRRPVTATSEVAR